MGILDLDPQTQGLLQAAFAGLQASGPSRMPTSFGQVLGSAGSAGLAGYDQAQKLQSALGLQDVETKLKKAQLDKALQDVELQKQLMAGGLTAGGVGGILNNPDMMEAVGTKLALVGHPGGAALVNAAGHRRKQIAEEAQFGTMKSPAPEPISSLGAGDLLPSTEGKAFTNPDVQTIPPEERGLFDAALNKARATNVATRGEGGIFGSLINSPIPQIAAQARAAQIALNAQPAAASIPPQHWVDIANRLATQEATLVSREQNLPKSEHVIQDKESPTGWSYEDTRSGKITKGAPQPAGAAPGDAIPAEHKDLHGADYLATLPTGMASNVQKMASGEVDVNSTASLRYGDRRAMKERILQYDPTYTDARPRVYKAFTDPNGKTGQNITSLNMTISHLGAFMDLGDALKNNDVRAFNSSKNWLADQLGRPELNNLKFSSQAVGEELMRVFRQVNASEHEAKMFMERLGNSSSPAQITGAGQTAVGLLMGRLDSINGSWKRGANTDTDFPRLLDDKSKLVLQRIAFRTGAIREFATEGDATKANLAPGTRVRINGVLGTWK